MFVTNKRNIYLPAHIIIDENNVEVVNCFKLLGITIDNKLTFQKYVSDIRNSINKRLYSINRLFYLSHKVRLQFYKSFILPYFDYCLSLLIYFPKRALQKLANTYFYCSHKLLHLNFSVSSIEDFNKINIELNKFNIDCFQHRLIKRISRFIYNVYNQKNGPVGLKSCLTRNHEHKTVMLNLRNKNMFFLPSKGKFNDHMEDTFIYFYSKFINEFLFKDLNLRFSLFCQRIENNINISFIKFCKLFPKFDLKFKIFYNN